MCEEKLELIRDFVTTLQTELDEIKDGFELEHRGKEYHFTLNIKDRLEQLGLL